MRREKGGADARVVTRVRATVQERVQPLLDATTARLYDVLAGLTARKDATKKKVRATRAPTHMRVSPRQQVAESYANDAPAPQEAVDAFSAAAARAGIRVEAPTDESGAPIADGARDHARDLVAGGAPDGGEETEVAAQARAHAEDAMAKGASFADAAKGTVEEKVNGAADHAA
jgi:hypothetical protein